MINEMLRMSEDDDDFVAAAVDSVGKCLPSIPHEENGDPVQLDSLYQHEEFRAYDGYSGLREAMADRVARKKLTRPFRNRLRNQHQRDADIDIVVEDVVVEENDGEEIII